MGPYSQAVEAGGALCSGTAPDRRRVGPDGRGHRGPDAPVAHEPRHILREAGYDYSDVVKTTVLLQSIGDFAAMNAVYAEFFTSEMPARMCY